jgi:hydroxymethylpyrimidine pyrophosphatase-like HAD family hydrolase
MVGSVASASIAAAASPPDEAARSGQGRLGSAHNLLRDLDALSRLLVSETETGSWLNAFLVAAGMTQIVEDRLHRDPFSSRKVARNLEPMLGSVGKMAGTGVRAGATGAAYARGLLPGEGRERRFRTELAMLSSKLAAVVAGADEPDKAGEMLSTARRLRSSAEQLPLTTRRDVIKLPASFLSFDQYPEDLDWLTGEFARRWPDRERPLLVVGIRTSGVYLAPLCAAYLARRGYRTVSDMTLRPAERLTVADREQLENLRKGGGIALLVDDPPGSGGTIAATARRLEMQGVDRDSIVLLLQLFGEADAVPEKLRDRPAVVLPFSGWHVHRLLAPESVRQSMNELLRGRSTVTSVKMLTGPAEPQREHVQATFEMAGQGPGEVAWVRRLGVRGVGLGLFGEQAAEVADRLSGYLPVTFGLKDGLLFQELPPDNRRLGVQPRVDTQNAVAAAIADYVHTRSQALGVPEDMSLRVRGRNAIWQRTSDVLGLSFGRSAFLARFVLHNVSRRLLHTRRPSVIDGNTALSRWFRRADDSMTLLKVGGEGHAFSNRDLFCYDAVFDLAGAAASSEDAAFGDDVRQSWARLTDESISEERWLFYQLIHLQEVRALEGDTPELSRRLDRRMQRYLARTIFDGVPIPQSGALCAIDIDGVLETGRLGFSATTPAGATALRALTLHGYRPVLVTGRCLDDVRDRCLHYHLAGGVAEYGAMVYDHLTGQVRCLLDASETSQLDLLRDALTSIPGVLVDEACTGIVRAYSNDSGHARALDSETVNKAVRASGSAGFIRVVPGVSQTDFVPALIDKRVGLSVLAEQLANGQPSDRRVRFAMGDTTADVPMFGLAESAFMPANGQHEARVAGVKVMKKPFGAGVFEAAAHVLGHPPGGCPTCVPLPLTAETSLVMTALSAQDRDGWGRIRTTVALEWRRRSVPLPAVGTAVTAQPAPAH